MINAQTPLVTLQDFQTELKRLQLLYMASVGGPVHFEQRLSQQIAFIESMVEIMGGKA